MTRFTDGPAAGKTLLLKRTPLFLRAVVDAAGKWDTLDMLGDEPDPYEAVYAYRRVGQATACHVDYRDGRGRRRGDWFQGGDYALVEPQPEEAVPRDTGAWREWAEGEAAKRKGGG